MRRPAYTASVQYPSAGDPTRQAPQVTVVVLNWNGVAYIERCLAALAGQTYPSYDVVVVDNGSTDGSAELVAERFPWVRLIRNQENRGFAAGNNQAILGSDAPYVATLNNDAFPEPGWLGTLVEAAESDPSLGSVASKMVFAHDPSTINSCGIGLDRAGIAWDLWGGHPASVVERRREVFGPCAGAALYRRAMLDDVGLFDEDFFAYLEDVDLAWRARLRGWRSVLAPDALVAHVHSGTLGDASPRKLFLLGRNKVWVLTKCLPSRDPMSVVLALAYDLASVAVRIARGEWHSVRGRVAALAGLGMMLNKRRAIQATRAATAAQMRASYEPLVPPWRVPERYRHLDRGPRGLLSDAPKSENRQAHSVPDHGIALQEALHRGPTTRNRLRLGLLRLTGALLRRGRWSASDQRAAPARAAPRIVLLRPDHLGDVLLARPAIQLIRESLPSAEVTVIAGPWGVASLQGLGCRVVSFPFPGFTRKPKASPLAPYTALLSFVAQLMRERFDAAAILRPDHWWGALACALAGIPVRVGQAVASVEPFLTHAVPIAHEPAPATSLRAAEALIGALGVTPAPGVPSVAAFSPTPEALESMQAWLHASFGGKHPIVALHPGAGAAVKLWPAPRWARAVRALVEDEVGVLLTGRTEDAGLVRAIQAQVGRPLPEAADLSWNELAALYASIDLVMGMDSGPLHLATAVGTPTVRIYGPSDPRVYGPAGHPSDHRVLASDMGCAPCGELVAPPCGYLQHPPCLAHVSVEEVLEQARAALAKRAGPAPRERGAPTNRDAAKGGAAAAYPTRKPGPG